MVDNKNKRIRTSAQERRFLQFLALCELDVPGFLAETEFSTQRVSNWFRRSPPKVPEDSMPKLHEVAANHDVTGLSSDWLNLGVGLAPEFVGHLQPNKASPSRRSGLKAVGTAPTNGPAHGMVRIQLLDGFSSDPTQFVDIASSLLRDDVEVRSPSIRGVYNPSDAMTGKIEKGDLVLVDTSVTAVTSEGIYAYKIDKISFVKKILIRGTGALRLQGTDPDDQFDMLGAERSKLKISGRVVGCVSYTKF